MKQVFLFTIVMFASMLLASCANELHEKQDANTKAENVCPEDTTRTDNGNGGYHGSIKDWGEGGSYETSPQS